MSDTLSKDSTQKESELQKRIDSQPYLMVHFQLPGCPPCRTIEPILKQMHKEAPMIPHYFAKDHEVELLAEKDEFKSKKLKFPYTATFVKGQLTNFISGATADSLLQRKQALLQLPNQSVMTTTTTTPTTP